MDSAINSPAPIPIAAIPAAQPRTRGSLRLSSKPGPDRAVLDDLYQSGSSKALFPRSVGPDLMAVCLNTAGGLTGGDRIDIAATAGRDSHLTLTTQAAERLYRAQPGEVAHVSTRLVVDQGARLDWLPQETILFDRSALRRQLDIRIAGDARLLVVEPVVFGRAAMGETLGFASFQDNVRLLCEDALIFADASHLSGNVADHLQSTGIAGGAGAMAAVLYAAPNADQFLTPVRSLMSATGGVSLIRPGVLFARLLAPDSFILRQTLIPLIELLRGAPLPKTWML